MTKHEYIEEYGHDEAIHCENCGEYFHASDAKTVTESHGEETPICPYCGSDYLEYPESYEMVEDQEDEE
jgi:formylmethanofuran dehydrogenase subunit E